MPCWGSQWPFRLCKCILCCSQTSPGGKRVCKRNYISISACCNNRITESDSALYFSWEFSAIHTFLSTFLLIPLLPSVFLASVLPPQGKGYSVLLFEVDICIIRLGCVIVSGLPHQRVLQRRERAVQSNNGWVPSSLTLPTSLHLHRTHPTRAVDRSFALGLAAVEWRERERERG